MANEKKGLSLALKCILSPVLSINIQSMYLEMLVLRST